MVKTWNGAFVNNNLQLNTPKNDTFTSLLGLSLRKNPKRAHLLVSTVLGKHIPQQPAIIKYAAGVLGEKILANENPDYVATRSTETLIKAINFDDFAVNAPLSHEPENKFVVFGYAETATGLGACVAEVLKADYIHSTRSPEPGRLDYGSFEEEHSHATSHHITPPDNEFFENKIIVLVDDELTTGKTVINTIEMFEQKQHTPVYYIATLTDLRTEESHRKFAEFEKAAGVKVHVVSLTSAEVVIPENTIEKANKIIFVLKQFPELTSDLNAEVNIIPVPFELEPLKNGVGHADFEEYKKVAEELAEKVTFQTMDKVLVLGNEEETYLPLLVAEKLAENKEIVVHSSSTTRSPVVAYNNPEYAIRTRIKYKIDIGQGLEKRFAYNITPGFYTHIVLVLEPGEVEQLSWFIKNLKTLTQKITIIERTSK